MGKQTTIEEQIAKSNYEKGKDVNAATPEEAFKAPKDKNRQDRILTASIKLALSLEMEFKLYSYRIHSPETFMYNLHESVNAYTKVKTENT